MEKILSISIAAYNIEKYICSTIESLINRDVLDKMEILIISDGSTDKTVKIGKEYEKKYPGSVRVIEKENGGWGSTVNAGIQNARGKYFKLIDGDDQAMRQTENLPDFVQYLEKNNYDLILTPYIEFIDETGELKEKISYGEFARGGISASDIPEACAFKYA